jgi:hypothetical protein
MYDILSSHSPEMCNEGLKDSMETIRRELDNEIEAQVSLVNSLLLSGVLGEEEKE